MCFRQWDNMFRSLIYLHVKDGVDKNNNISISQQTHLFRLTKIKKWIDLKL